MRAALRSLGPCITCTICNCKDVDQRHCETSGVRTSLAGDIVTDMMHMLKFPEARLLHKMCIRIMDCHKSAVNDHC